MSHGGGGPSGNRADGDNNSVPGNYPEHPSYPDIEQPEMEEATRHQSAYRRSQIRNLHRTAAEAPPATSAFGDTPARSRANTAIRAGSDSGSDSIILRGSDGNDYKLGNNKTSVRYLHRQISAQEARTDALVDRMTATVVEAMDKSFRAFEGKFEKRLQRLENGPQQRDAAPRGEQSGFAIPPEGVRLGAHDNLDQPSPPENFYRQMASGSRPPMPAATPSRSAPQEPYRHRDRHPGALSTESQPLPRVWVRRHPVRSWGTFQAILGGSAILWWTNELMAARRIELRSAGLLAILDELIVRFGPDAANATKSFYDCKLYLRDVAADEQALQQFVQKKLRWARSMRMLGPDHSNWSSAMMMIWSHMEFEIQQCLPRPDEFTSLSDYMKKIEKSRIIVNSAALKYYPHLVKKSSNKSSLKSLDKVEDRPRSSRSSSDRREQSRSSRREERYRDDEYRPRDRYRDNRRRDRDGNRDQRKDYDRRDKERDDRGKRDEKDRKHRDDRYRKDDRDRDRKRDHDRVHFAEIDDDSGSDVDHSDANMRSQRPFTLTTKLSSQSAKSSAPHLRALRGAGRLPQRPIQASEALKTSKSVFDPGAGRSIVGRNFLRNLDHTIEKREGKVSGVGGGILKLKEWATFSLYLPGIENGKKTLFKFTRGAWVIDKLLPNLLLGNDFMDPYRANIDYDTKIVHLRAIDFAVPFSIREAMIPVNYKPLPKGRSFLFNAEHDAAFHAVITAKTPKVVAVKNTSRGTITIPKRYPVGKIDENHDSGFLACSWNTAFKTMAVGATLMSMAKPTTIGDIEPANFALQNTNSLPVSAEFDFDKRTAAVAEHDLGLRAPDAPTVENYNGTSSTPSTLGIRMVDNLPEIVTKEGVHIFAENSQLAARFAELVRRFPRLWEDTGLIKLPPEQLMRVPLVEGWQNQRVSSRSYPLSRRDRQLLDEIFDGLHKQGKMIWATRATPFAHPVFVVWRTVKGVTKGRVVIDLRGLNRVSVPDNYPLPLQAEIIGSLRGKRYITAIDATAFFYQFGLHPPHRDRFTLISPRGLEQPTVCLMGYRNSPAHVQRIMDQLLKPHAEYARAFIDDIVIFSNDAEDHLKHLERIFRLFHDKNVAIAPTKSFIGYPSVELLGFRVDSLGLTTTAQRVEAFRNLAFPKTLKALEQWIGATGFLRHLIPYYAQLLEPLQKRKTALLAQGRENGQLVSGNQGKRANYCAKTTFEPSEAERLSFDSIQKVICAENPSILYHFDPDKPLFLQVDGCLERGCGVMVFHVQDGYEWKPGSVIPSKQVQPVMFLSRCLTKAELRYGPSEQEVACLVWAVKKLRTMIHSSRHPVNVLTDHSSTRGIVEQTRLDTSSTDRSNRRLITASVYLSEYDLKVFHLPGRLNFVPDALSRLTAVQDKPEREEGEVILDNVMFAWAEAQMDDSLKNEFIAAYHEDSKYSAIIKDLISGEPAEGSGEFFRPGLPFVLTGGLLYNIRPDGLRSICIPHKMVKTVLSMVHDQKHHFGVDRMLYDLRGVSMVNQELAKVTKVCPSTAPQCNRLSCKSSKRTLLIPGHTTYTAQQWGQVLMRQLFLSDWGVPSAIISDRDRKFTSEFWQAMWESLGTKLLMTAAYHPQSDGLAERKNQTVEIAMRFFVFERPEANWTDLITPLQWNLNSSYSAPIQSSPHEQLFGFKLPGPFEALAIPPSVESDIPSMRESLREDARLAMDFAAARAKRRYDANRRDIEFREGDKVYLRLHKGYHLPGNPPRKLSQQRTGPFEVVRRVGRLAYELKFPENMGIHPVISIAHLSPTPPGNDPFDRHPVPPGPVEDSQASTDSAPGEDYEVEVILRHRVTRRKYEYLIKWKGWGHEHNVWKTEYELRHTPRLLKEYWQRQGGQPALPGDDATEPRRKRGRPRKNVAPAEEAPAANREPEVPPKDGRRRSRRLVPTGTMPTPASEEATPASTTAAPQ
ncbi:hypothetical protein CHGG_08393 [Chaetomium globosum CBS 148.51]|uniref:RNA-directed DNA polymerase n=1 Tax=Chaetomium globosum (strain ATCC 6205 / CBS 148.51 / DSM 1962 / NBRC 6347 / NRRL 1970) TaxID=306901 RepID=Q2GUG1_CHAGB|nr:uncharacterized protein CHGG_08393 [Chaetomium globosum CBS 148.51]EAQ84379.1 hypothetical protein CHGG_08393 [Chaetomium globosum CBS 148.51]